MAPAFGKAPKRSSTKLFGHVCKRQKLSKEERAKKKEAKRLKWAVPAGSKPPKRDKSAEVPRAPKVAPPPHEPTRRQTSVVDNEKTRQEVIARKADTDAKNKARREELFAKWAARRAKTEEENETERIAVAKAANDAPSKITKEEKERIAEEAKAAAFDTLVRNAPFTNPELGERSPSSGGSTPCSTPGTPNTPE
jgi:hypothetical protein